MRTRAFVCLLLALQQAFSHAIPDNVRTNSSINQAISGDVEQKCAADLKLDPKEIEKAYKEDLKLVVGDIKYNEYFACTWTERNYLTEKGEIDSTILALLVQKIMLHLRGVDDMDQVVKLIEEHCLSVPHGPNDAVVKVHNCIMDRALEFGDKLGKGEYPPDEECVTELGLDHKIAESVVDAYQKIPEGNEKINQYMDCLWKHYTWLQEDGTFHHAIGSFVRHRVLASLGLHDMASVSLEIVERCAGTRGLDPGDTAVLTYNCLIIPTIQHIEKLEKSKR